MVGGKRATQRIEIWVIIPRRYRSTMTQAASAITNCLMFFGKVIIQRNARGHDNISEQSSTTMSPSAVKQKHPLLPWNRRVVGKCELR